MCFNALEICLKTAASVFDKQLDFHKQLEFVNSTIHCFEALDKY
jgi:hypothetical protein